ncbi:hypothetical protein CUMW_267790 [Citrus unshiu]|uniref:Uncharacterized protein n=1 Tax=Citrus unshiu TaxID=55188 RepID=A0A2H5QWD0_CITUN|nr:hypothetical protein CUMW_267790 [Citrus unshiu]
MAIGLKTVWTLRIAPRHQSTVHGLTTWMNSNTSNRIMTPHQSMLHHRSMPHHRSVYVNSIVNSNIDSTVHVNNTIFPFMLLLRFSTVLSSKVMSVLPFDLSFIVK